MATALVRISAQTHRLLKELAKRTGEPMRRFSTRPSRLIGVSASSKVESGLPESQEGCQGLDGRAAGARRMGHYAGRWPGG